MCGLTGFITSTSWSAERLTSALVKMTDTIVHRGPDDSGTFVDPSAGVAIGFRRLSIVDLSPMGHQPMEAKSGRYVLAFNGEIYNYQDLRRPFEAEGEKFRGHSDTEVILAAFDRWGIAASLPKLSGMFAMSVWDRERRELTLIRDRMGKKPLFVYSEPGLVSYGSELKALRAGPSFRTELDQVALAQYFRYLCVPAPGCIYRHAIKLPPGSLLTIADPNRALPAPTVYWSVEQAAARGAEAPFTGSDDEAVTRLEALLKEETGLRMVADVPIGALLSGGIDSSTVVALMQAQSPRPIKTYTIGFDQRRYDEAEHADAVARHLGTEHRTLRLSGADALALVPEIPDWFDEPLADPSQLPTYLVSKLAREEVTVALTGDGGDELFGGYNRYVVGTKLLGAFGSLPSPVRKLAGAGARLVGSLGGDLRSLTGRIRKAGEVMLCDSPGLGYRSLLSAWQRPQDILPGVVEPVGPFEAAFARPGPDSMLRRMMLADQQCYLPDDLLAKVDRASMAVSLEARCPILDHRVVEFAWSLPDRFKIRGGVTKWVLREVLYRHVPRDLVDRPKMGFSVPVSGWLTGPLKGWGDELLAEGSLRQVEGLDPTACRAAWRELQGGQAHRGLSLWGLLVFLDWRRRWIGA